MSKKIAEGIDALVLDVKCGQGAFMKKRDDAHRLAESLVATGQANGVRTEALITRMEAPLGRAVGNALEVAECIATLNEEGPTLLAAKCTACGTLSFPPYVSFCPNPLCEGSRFETTPFDGMCEV